MSEFPTGLELFEQFRPRFEHIELRPRGWIIESYSIVQKYGLLNYRGEKEVAWHSRYTNSFVDIREAGLQVSFAYDSGSELDIHSQFSEAVSERVAGLLAGQTFRLVPGTPFDRLVDGNGRELSQYLKVEPIGNTVPGLHLYKGGYSSGESGHWDSFVPRGTPEAEAIQAALIYHYKQTLKPRDVSTEQQEAEERLALALREVA